MARKALRRCAAALADGWPQDVVAAAECALPGFVVCELVTLPEGVSAIVDVDDRSIGVNAALPEARKRFSIAHEVGHVILEHPLFVFPIEGRQDLILEREANAFAAEFLVPMDVLRKSFRHCRDYEELARRFLVDRDVMYYRFRDAKLLRQVW
jgi:Zn-dependent peptidase ImmA (M78 family)